MKYGPQTTEIETLIERLFRLTPDEIQSLAATRAATPAARDVAWAAADAADEAARDAAWAAADEAAAATDEAWDAAWADAWDPDDAAMDAAAAWTAGDAALGLATRHLIGTCGYTWDYYRTLVEPVATVLGKLHSDD